MIEICNYVYRNYPDIKNAISYDDLLKFLIQNERNIIYVEEDGKIKGVAFYLKVDDETLDKFRKEEIHNIYDLNYKLYNGDNIYIPMLIADSAETILIGMNRLIKRECPTIISWRRNKFFERRL